MDQQCVEFHGVMIGAGGLMMMMLSTESSQQCGGAKFLRRIENLEVRASQYCCHQNLDMRASVLSWIKNIVVMLLYGNWYVSGYNEFFGNSLLIYCLE